MADKVINYFLTANPTAFVSAFRKAGASITDVRDRGLALKATLGSLAGVMGVGAFVGAIKSQIEFADSLDDTAQKAGSTAKELSTLAYAMKIEGMSVEDMNGALVKLNKTMVDAATGGKESASTFKALGVSIKNEDGTLRRSDEVLLDVADRLSEIDDGAVKSAVAMRLFGKSGADMIPFLNRGREGIASLRQEARDLGLEIENNTAAAAGDFNDNLTRMGEAARGVARQIAADLLPTLRDVTEELLAGRKLAGSWWGAITTFGTMNPFDSPLESVLRYRKQIDGLNASLKLHQDRGFATGRIESQIEEATKKLRMAEIRLGKQEAPQNQEEDDKASAAWGAVGATPRKPTIKITDLENDKKGPELNRTSQWENDLAAMKVSQTVSLQQEKAFWASKLKLAAAGSNERLSVEKRALDIERAIKEDAYAKEVQQLQFVAEQNKFNFNERVRLATEEQALIVKRYGAESKEAAAAANRIADLQKQGAEQQERIDEIREATRDERALAALEEQERLAQLEVDLGNSTQVRLLEQTKSFEDRKYEIQRSALERRLQLLQGDPTSDPVAIAQAQAQIETLTIQHESRKSEINSQTVIAQRGSWTGLWTDMRTGGENMLQSLLAGQMRWQQLATQGLSVVSQAFSGFVAKRISAWMAGETAETAATATGAATRTGIEATAAVTSTSIKGTTALTNIATSAYEAAAGAYAAIAAIPYVGPFLAPAVAAGALAAVIGFGASIFSAEGGFDIPSGVNPIVQLHEEEMVLPKAQANAVRDMAAGGRTGGGAEPAQAVEQNTYNIHAVDAASFERMLRRNPAAVAGALKLYTRGNGKVS
ncbi:hypothetical protein GCM10007242_45490 [Pigmentiphaga litoralis]|uniref:phage tail tape measure protein n=1 Tax=Pigmentiphaga litoralis TaxID=516702 RepID=UPI001676846B|nr:phage tail tape measure protein [Pigmentiphaga litoralis]GGX33253.1 hypothetical protein GCM10007242_45490 [Pigmentiphaga litoralis]